MSAETTWFSRECVREVKTRFQKHIEREREREETSEGMLRERERERERERDFKVLHGDAVNRMLWRKESNLSGAAVRSHGWTFVKLQRQTIHVAHSKGVTNPTQNKTAYPPFPEHTTFARVNSTWPPPVILLQRHQRIPKWLKSCVPDSIADLQGLLLLQTLYSKCFLPG